MASPPPAPAVEFVHPTYTLEGKDKLVKITGVENTLSPEEELQTLVESLSAYIRAYIKSTFNLVETWIPSDDVPAKCDILMSQDWDTAPKLLVLLQNHVGSQIGLWSRSTCLQKGIRKGSMIPFLEHARAEGFAVIICNPNLNSVMVKDKDGNPEKKLIRDSSFPEEHSMFVYENFVSQSQARHICLFGYGNGAILCKEMLQASPSHGPLTTPAQYAEDRKSPLLPLTLSKRIHPKPCSRMNGLMGS